MIDDLIDNLADIFLGQVNIIKLIGPTIRHGDLVDLIEVLIDSVGELFFVLNPDASKHLLGHFAEESLDKIQPRTMGGCEHELESARNRVQVHLCLPGSMGGVVIENQSDLIAFWILSVQFLQELHEIRAFVGFADKRDRFSGEQINGSQQGNGSISNVFIVPLESVPFA